MNTRGNFPLWIILAGVGCIGLTCICALAIAGLAYLRTAGSTVNVPDQPVEVQPSPRVEQLPTTLPTPLAAAPTAPAPVNPALVDPAPVYPSITPPEPAPTATSPLVEPPATSPSSLTGNQRLDNHVLIDDFSSNALNWPVYDDGSTILKYENQAYSFQIAEPDYYDWAYFPVDFIPYEISFDVQGQAGEQDGTFGVFCQFLDEDNYYYAEFDLADGSYLIGEVVGGEDSALTDQNEQGQYWQMSTAFDLAPEAINRINLSCYLESITLFINEQWVDEVSVVQPFEEPGEAAFFVYTFDFAGPQGYKVFFDNVEIWQPAQ